MRIGFMVNDVKTELESYTTTRLAASAINMGHDVWVMGAADFEYGTDDKIHACARSAPQKQYKSIEVYLKQVQGSKAVVENITVDDLDVLMLRSDPSTETGERTWAQTAGINFGRVAMRSGVIVLNDPNGLAKAINKMYFQLFPEEVRPRTLISRDPDALKQFAKSEGGRCVLKPLLGSGGTNVFLVRPGDMANINQMIEAVSRDGYVIAQEYLPAAAEGDTRLFLMNGRPYRYQGKHAAFRRVRSGEDMRSNIHAGGKKAQALVDAQALRIAEIVRPKLVEDGMFLVGLDIVGDKLMEINVFSPGGLGSSESLYDVNFAPAIIEELERKVSIRRHYPEIDNRSLATG